MNNTEQTVSSLFLLNPNVEHVIIGVIYVGLALPIIPVYVVFIYVLTTDHDLAANNMYKLTKQFSVVNFGQILLHIVVSFFIIFPHMERKYQVIVRTAACTLNSLWLAMYPIMSVLAISRILIMKEITSSDRSPLAMRAFGVIGWLYTISVWLWGCFTQNTTLSGVSIAYDLTKLGASVLAQMEWYLCVSTLVVSWGAYFVIALHMQATKRESRCLSWSREGKILLQATVLATFMLCIVIVSHYSDQWLRTDVSIAALHAAWILFPYSYPTLYMSLNLTICKKVFQSIGCPFCSYRKPTVTSNTVNKSSFLKFRSQSHKG
ncbi:hypothetical protein Y032_0022g618 [Ancylostoma ceylanicum]|uniref:G-protein coupled receptors family 1 profile domain-containing protein n=1 Tax=Ancylostoma ceylanicum TaxID=53326 RepID=A0A016V114_9BILA|nr:hypothetical protein Y032_0022g618 [Ancylostoma ceylanicum]